LISSVIDSVNEMCGDFYRYASWLESGIESIGIMPG
jgi:hypothetical protein